MPTVQCSRESSHADQILWISAGTRLQQSAHNIRVAGEAGGNQRRDGKGRGHHFYIVVSCSVPGEGGTLAILQLGAQSNAAVPNS